jgi:hypothetical protein
MKITYSKLKETPRLTFRTMGVGEFAIIKDSYSIQNNSIVHKLSDKLIICFADHNIITCIRFFNEDMMNFNVEIINEGSIKIEW